ncbi:hypothetical protein C1T17_16340 [Sphingobium sp. SCG-1]|uniref:hypothetical protein n=1 Tax=Sphingobium sp. SCG-1 TaxID=2072936 RepID=UPI000CD6BC18|nr:hypothetical protein [Sphingobium sp. SCG-1]AUW59422.1 hypothetical protein C1T17_16340 [Sphingobium sp. SCG-1]
MKHVVIIPACNTGSTAAREIALAMAMLNALHDAGGSVPAEKLRKQLGAAPREMFALLRSQFLVGTIMPHMKDQPIALSPAARTAITAARAAVQRPVEAA